MATAADQANQIYDPQAQAEQTTAGAAHTNAVNDLTQSGKSIDSQYATSFDNAAQARAGEAARTDFNYSSALDGNESGLHNNATAMQGATYQKLVKQLSDEQNLAHEGVQEKIGNENNSYSALMSSISSKYAGLKSGYQADALTKAQDQAFQKSLADQSNATALASAKLYGGGNSAATPGVSQQLGELFTDYQPASAGGKAGYTESHVIPTLMSQNPGMSHADAAKAAYDFRKQVFNE